MAEIHVLDDATIDKIAAGEVVERPASVVKELVENAMDAGATAITVEIKDGGIEFIRVTDNGSGIEHNQLRNAFLRHATSKISSVVDLMRLHSMGFRGEALSSIAAVAKVEIVTKTKEDMTGARLCLEGAKEISFEEVGAPDGTTFIVRNLFFNTPVRRKFLKTAMTEASYITDLLEHMALSRPEISFKYVINGQTKFYTNGDGDMKAIIYRIFGRDIANEMLAFQAVDEEIVLEGFLGKPTLNRANRNFENYFVNRRYIKSKVISKAIEEGYASYMMQHRYPFCVLHITVPPESVDVNVHPTKMEVRFSDQNSLYKLIAENITDFLSQQEMILDAVLGPEKKEKKDKKTTKIDAPEPFEKERRLTEQGSHIDSEQPLNILKDESKYNSSNSSFDKETQEKSDVVSEEQFFVDNRGKNTKIGQTNQNVLTGKILGAPSKETDTRNLGVIKSKDHILVEKPEQLNFFDEKILTREAKQEYRIVGQVFDTYWIIEYRDKMLMIDQHAAHEKVKYEQILTKVEHNEIYTQMLTPPAVISVTPKESALINSYAQYFKELGFEIEDFGMNAFAIRGVPIDLFGHNIKELFEEILTQMCESPVRGVPQIIREKIASMACKAAVKGNHSLTYEEANKLIEQLLELENPYNCPHGRPTIISMSKYEIEKKFKRIV
ncbi:MAG: DNA mismatch repair endonuclease MutL [Lachnospiraceae bacterium]|jgi:DNA mismatch repair protein MutL|nr:DNA mismatch repair endonuclease MutL [Lachnospiraceae bacterium]